jgi:hypothetical protein
MRVASQIYIVHLKYLSKIVVLLTGSKRFSSPATAFKDFKKKRVELPSESRNEDFSDESDEEASKAFISCIANYKNEKLQDCLQVIWNLPSGVRKVTPKLSHDGKSLLIKFNPPIQIGDVQVICSGEVRQRTMAASVSQYLNRIDGKAEAVIPLPFACLEGQFHLVSNPRDGGMWLYFDAIAKASVEAIELVAPTSSASSTNA